MNAKTRKVLEDLLNAVKMCRVPGTYEEAVKAGEKLLNPPVKFVWSKIGNAYRGWSYQATVGDYHYHVEQNQDKGVKGWSCWVCSSRLPIRDIGIPLHYQGIVHPTLALAKQHCVDYGVAAYQTKRSKIKAAQIHTAPHIRKALMP